MKTYLQVLRADVKVIQTSDPQAAGKMWFCFRLRANVFVITSSRWPSSEESLQKYCHMHMKHAHTQHKAKYAYASTHTFLLAHEARTTYFHKCAHEYAELISHLHTERIFNEHTQSQIPSDTDTYRNLRS